MKILGIESSCDETAAAVIEDGVKILSNVVASSQEMHAKTGGIIPEQAARQQITSIIPVIHEALIAANLKSQDIDAIAVTVGPGLIGSLLVGVETAKTLSLIWNKPIVPVNHLVGHIYANWLSEPTPNLPAIALVVSGGHTDLVLLKKHGVIEHIGSTRDDAAGEAFDKSARLLGLPYPGGPSISKASTEFRNDNPNFSFNLFPRPLKGDGTFDFSFSGLKTAVLREVKDKNLDSNEVKRMSAEIEEAITEILVDKTLKACQKYKVNTLLLGGGVAANSRLKECFVVSVKEATSEKDTKEVFLTLHVPEPKLCTDNAAYIAACAFYNYNPIDLAQIAANPQLSILQSASIA